MVRGENIYRYTVTQIIIYFLVIGHRVYTQFMSDFGSLLFTETILQSFSWLMLRNSKLQLPPQIFYWVYIWRLTMNHAYPAWSFRPRATDGRGGWYGRKRKIFNICLNDLIRIIELYLLRGLVFIFFQIKTTCLPSMDGQCLRSALVYF